MTGPQIALSESVLFMQQKQEAGIEEMSLVAVWLSPLRGHHVQSHSEAPQWQASYKKVQLWKYFSSREAQKSQTASNRHSDGHCAARRRLAVPVCQCKCTWCWTGLPLGSVTLHRGGNSLSNLSGHPDLRLILSNSATEIFEIPVSQI